MRNKFDTKYVDQAMINREWLVIDAADQTLGRIASKIAAILRGKHKPSFQPSVDVGDFVIIINAEKVSVSGRKFQNKIYNWYTGFPGGIKRRNFATMQKERPEHILEQAVKRMLPKGRLGRAMFRKMFIYTGPNHPHHAQKPKSIEI